MNKYALLIATLSAGIVAVPAYGVATKVIGTAKAAGDSATAIASGSVDNPRAITVTVLATPRQKVDGDWTVVCSKGFGAGSKSGQFSGMAPLTRKIKLPMSRPDHCDAAGLGSLSSGGKLRVILKAA
jgi:hypothetical protein